jgi:hypothetical protein
MGSLATAAELAGTAVTRGGRVRRFEQRRDKGNYAIRASHEPLSNNNTIMEKHLSREFMRASGAVVYIV